MKAKKQTLIAFCIACLCFSCKKFVDVPPSPQLIEAGKIFKDSKTALSAVNGVYVFMRSSSIHPFNSAISVYGGVSSDEIYNTSSLALTQDYFLNSILPNNYTLSGFWNNLYTTIYRANAVIESTLNADLPVSDQEQFIGEMKVVRAFSYFYLVNLWGPVPYTTSTGYENNSHLSRTAIEEIYKGIIADLSDAQQHLTDTYPSAGRARPNKLTATALLARVYLYLNQWDKAETEAGKIIGNPAYELQSNLDNVFLKGSKETIWELASVNETGNTAEGSAFVPATSATSRPNNAITDYLNNRFAANDQRKSKWLRSKTVSGVVYVYPFKYKQRATVETVSEYYVVMRLAEQYLIRAEARAQQDKLELALEDLNTIRNRAGLPNASATGRSDVLKLIGNERQVELFAEWAHRWFDLKRWNLADAVLSVNKNGWQPHAKLFPIPFDQLLYNPNLKQNEGY